MSIYERLNSLENSLKNLLSRGLTSAASLSLTGAVTASAGNFTTLTASNASITNLSGLTNLTASNISASAGLVNLTILSASNANIDILTASNLNLENLNINNNLAVSGTTIFDGAVFVNQGDSFTAVTGSITRLTASNFSASNAVGNFSVLTASNLNIGNQANFGTLFAENISVTGLTVTEIVNSLTASQNIVFLSEKGVYLNSQVKSLFNNASASTNVLIDYEEGVWTPTYSFQNVTSSTTTYTTSGVGGRYTKIGNLVTVHGYLATDSTGSLTPANELHIGGLPYTSNVNNRSTLNTSEFYNFNIPLIDIKASIAGNVQYIRLFKITGSQTLAETLKVSDMRAGSFSNIIFFSGQYIV